MEPFLIYYLHYKDEGLRLSYWNTKQDFVCCVMAVDAEEAIEKTKKIATSSNDSFIKIMGVAKGIEKWVNEHAPL